MKKAEDLLADDDGPRSRWGSVGTMQDVEAARRHLRKIQAILREPLDAGDEPEPKDVSP